MTATPEKIQRDLLTLVTGALASLVLIGTSLTALNKNVIGFRAWPGTSSEPTPIAVLPAAEPEASSTRATFTRATFGFTGPSGTSSLAIVGLPGAGLPGFRLSPVAPGAATGVSTRTTIGEAPVGPPAPEIPAAPTPTPVPTPAVTPIASAAVTAGPVPASISAPGKTTNQPDTTPDRKAGKGRRKDKVHGKPGSSAAPQATAAAAPGAQSSETTRESASAGPVATKAAATKGKGNATPQRRHEERVTAAPRRKEPENAGPAAAPAPPAAVAPPAPTSAAAPSVGHQSPGNGPQDTGRPDNGGKGRGPA